MKTILFSKEHVNNKFDEDFFFEKTVNLLDEVFLEKKKNDMLNINQLFNSFSAGFFLSNNRGSYDNEKQIKRIIEGIATRKFENIYLKQVCYLGEKSFSAFANYYSSMLNERLLNAIDHTPRSGSISLEENEINYNNSEFEFYTYQIKNIYSNKIPLVYNIDFLKFQILHLANNEEEYYDYDGCGDISISRANEKNNVHLTFKFYDGLIKAFINFENGSRESDVFLCEDSKAIYLLYKLCTKIKNKIQKKSYQAINSLF